MLREIIELGIRAGLFNKDPEFDEGLDIFAKTGSLGLYNTLKRRCYATNFYTGRYRSQLFDLPYNTKDVSGEIPLGKIVDSNWDYSLKISELVRHIFLSGQPGTGKTVAIHSIVVPTIRAGPKVFAVDPKRDFERLLSEGVLVIKAEDFRINPLRPPNGISPWVWLPRIAQCLAESLRLLEASEGFVGEVIRITYDKWFPRGIQPCFREFADEVFNLGKILRGKSQTYQQTVENRVRTVQNSLGQVFECRNGYIEELADRSFVLDISGLVDIAQNVLVETIINWFYEFHRANIPKGSGKTRIIVVDESQHVVFNKAKQNSAKGAASSIERIIAMSREFGLGFIASCQRPEASLDELLSDAAFRGTFNLGSFSEIKTIGSAMGLTEEQMRFVQGMGVGTMVAKKNMGFTSPCLIKVTPVDIMIPSDALWEANEQEIKRLKDLSVPYKEEDLKGPRVVGHTLSERAKSLLLALGKTPTATITELYEMMEVNGTQGGKAKAELKNQSMATEHNLPGAGRTKFLHLKKDGIIAHENITGEAPDLLIRTEKASEPHDFATNKVCNFCKGIGASANIGVRLGKQEVDVLAKKNGVSTAYEITFSLSNIQKKVKLLEKVDRLVMVYETEARGKEIQKRLTIPKEVEHRISFLPLRNFL